MILLGTLPKEMDSHDPTLIYLTWFWFIDSASDFHISGIKDDVSVAFDAITVQDDVNRNNRVI